MPNRKYAVEVKHKSRTLNVEPDPQTTPAQSGCYNVQPCFFKHFCCLPVLFEYSFVEWKFLNCNYFNSCKVWVIRID